MSQLLGEASLRVLGVGIAAENGVASIEEASIAFDEYGLSNLLVSKLADKVIEQIGDAQGILWIGQVGEAASGVWASSVGISVGFDTETGEIDQQSTGIFLPGYDTAVKELLSSSILYEGENVCSG